MYKGKSKRLCNSGRQSTGSEEGSGKLARSLRYEEKVWGREYHVRCSFLINNHSFSEEHRFEEGKTGSKVIELRQEMARIWNRIVEIRKKEMG